MVLPFTEHCIYSTLLYIPTFLFFKQPHHRLTAAGSEHREGAAQADEGEERKDAAGLPQSPHRTHHGLARRPHRSHPLAHTRH